MGTRFNKAYVSVPLVYVAVIMGLFFLQFSRGATITDAVGDLQLTGVEGVEGEAIEELHIRFRGIDFAFGSRAAASLETADGSVRKLLPRDYEKDDRGFTILFDEDFSIRFSVEADASLIIRPGFRNRRGYAELTIPFSAFGGTQAASVERLPILSVRFNERNYLLSLPGASRIDMGRKHLIIVPDAGGSAVASMAEATGDSTESFFAWYASQAGAGNRELFNRRTSEYLNKAYEGWRSLRFLPEIGQWQTEQGRQEYRDTIAAAYLAEALRRGTFAAALPILAAAAQANRGRTGILAAAYLGDFRELVEATLSADAAESARLLSRIRSRDLSIFARADLAQFITDRASAEVYAAFLRFVQEADARGQSRAVVLGMLMNHLSAAYLPEDLSAALARFAPLLNTVIFPSIVKIDEGFFLESEPGRIDVETSITAGRVLILTGRRDRDETLESIGRDLIISAVALADNQGFLPRLLSHQDGALRSTEGRLAPENLYTLITENPYHPRFVSLSRQLGRGAWLFTGARIEAVEIAPDRARYAFRFPSDSTHHLAIMGALPYSELRLRGIPWRIDPRFERYPIGAFFDEPRRLFFAKYQHRREVEEILFRY